MTKQSDVTIVGPDPVIPVDAEGRGITQRGVEIWTAIVIVALACIVIWDNLRIGAGWGDNGPQAGYFPLRIGIIVGLCGAAIGYLGIYVASALFIMAFMIFAGRYPWWKSLVIAVATTVLMFFIFEIQFKVPLPKGPLETLFGY